MPPTLLGVPYDAKSSFLRGAARAPTAIRQALASPAGNSFSERFVDISALADAGDVPINSDDYPAHAIEEAVGAILAAGHQPLVLGGDHSITLPVVRAMHRRHGGAFTIVHFDAHNDLYHEYEGDPYSHACPLARVMEGKLASRLVQIGIRAMTPHLRTQADHFGVEVIDMQSWQSGHRVAVSGPVYVSLDLDVLDPAFAPGVSHREPGGLSVRELLGALDSTLAGATLLGCDLVELNPDRDWDGITATVAGKLCKELAGRLSTTA